MKLVFSVFCAAVLAAVIHFFSDKKTEPPTISNAKMGRPVTDVNLLRLRQFAVTARQFAKDKKYNESVCFLVDMKQSSGSNRFFVYDIKKDTVLLKGLVTHGSGLVASGTPTFSNIEGSNCTSLGKYKIGKPYNGRFGLAYKLYGLDPTNSKAYNRFVVLHAHSCVPDDEVSPARICMSLGCPTVSPAFLSQLKLYLDKPGKPVLLWIFN